MQDFTWTAISLVFDGAPGNAPANTKLRARSQRSLKPRERALRQPETKSSSEWSLLFGVIGSGPRARVSGRGILALDAPASPGGDIGRGGRHRRNLGERGGTGGGARFPPASTRASCRAFRHNPRNGCASRTFGAPVAPGAARTARHTSPASRPRRFEPVPPRAFATGARNRQCGSTPLTALR